MRTKLLYEKIMQELKEKIYTGEYSANDRLPTEADLAQQYGVSRITSKRALEELKKEGLVYRVRGSGSFVSEKGKARGQTLKKGGAKFSDTVAVLMPHYVTESSFAQSINGAIKELAKAGFYGIVYSSVKNAADERRVIRKIYEDGIQGIIYYPLSDRENYDLLHHLYLEEYPIVAIDKYFEGVPISSVVADNYKGGEMATQYLLGLGHRRIGFVSDLPIESATSIRDRYFGYAMTLKKAKVSPPESYIYAGFHLESHRGYQAEKYRAVVEALQKQGITGIVAMNDSVAIYTIRAAKEMGITIPDELSVVGFDDLKMAKHLSPPLTTIRQNFMDIGKCAAEMIIRKIRTKSREQEQIKLPVQLIERDSCKRIR